MEDKRLAGADLLLMCNKIDLPGGASTEELGKELGFLERSERQWHIQACSAITGEGVIEGLDWLTKVIKKSKA